MRSSFPFSLSSCSPAGGVREQSGVCPKPCTVHGTCQQAGREILIGLRGLIMEIMRLELKISGFKSNLGHESLGKAAVPKLCLCPGPCLGGGWSLGMQRGAGVFVLTFTQDWVCWGKVSPCPCAREGRASGRMCFIKEPHPSVGL